ncbi:MAG: LytTR family DNA-binding domain-containing protein [Acetatifactor sp.]|nr:LytTR family DNA-binding domain-containing protein [Acetatifactor sp.]
MINIAICDDDEVMTSLIEEMLYKIAEKQHINIDCAVFFDGSTLVENIRQGSYYDLIYLDIEMNKISGISAAELIRNMDIPALIVYVSGYEQHLKELFNTEPFRFLSKPINAETFHSVFIAAYKHIRQKAEYFSYTYNKNFIKVPLNQIYYFESRSRVIYIHVVEIIKLENTEYDETEYRFYGKMNDVEKQLSESNVRFIRIHQSYLVNYDFIKSMNFTSVVMSDGTSLQISENRQKSVHAQFFSMTGMDVHGNK